MDNLKQKTDLTQDRRIVLTLDAGGTNFVFSAIQANEEIIEPITLPAESLVLQKCLDLIVDGFHQCQSKIKKPIVAISFAFPGPSDFPLGIIGDLQNLPAFRGGVALGPMLENIFNLPVFINNDGNLFALGEAIAGLLPEINRLLMKAGSPKQFKNLFGITLGTGFGGGIVVNQKEMIIGDNSAAGEIWLIRNKLDPGINAEEGVSIRAVRRFYAEAANIDPIDVPEPKIIYQIATGQQPGNQEAAYEAFRKMAEIAGDAVANAVTLIDGLVVIGGGLAAAHPIFLNHLVNELNNPIGRFSRLETHAYNLENDQHLDQFIRGQIREITIPGTNKTIQYDCLARIGVGVSRLGTSKAVGIGAYAFALNALDKA